jgi:prepilin peptidase CpaA
MSGVFALCLLGIAVLMALAAAVWDLRTRTIPNGLNAAIALLAIPFWWASGLELWPDMMIQLGIGVALFGAFSLAFSLGAMGGGDVKLIGALGLWLPLNAVMPLLIIMSLVGGVLTIGMLVRHRLAKHQHKLEIPYGVATAIGAVWLIGEQFLNQFA